MTKASILVVDDEPLNLEIIAEFLSDGGHRLQSEGDGEAAWAQLDAAPERFDLIILDRMMPGLDGLALLRRIKADPRLRGLPVIMQTAAGSNSDVREGLEAGAYYYLVKPFAPTTLLAIVGSALIERARWKELTQLSALRAAAVGMMGRASFAIGTPEEALALAALLASAADDPESVALGLSELMVNGIEHGNLGIDLAGKAALVEADTWATEIERRQALPENVGKRVWLDVVREGEDWRVRITDEGAGFVWGPFLELDPARAFAPNGRGIALARRLAFNDLRYIEPGNSVEVRYRARPK
ncbi:response regulator [Uliginosibacterium sp. sgz301328]|uniref:response regulator n=1 Tax=Uliginosibacterium sp. sgz301328 TaxID=3243764 RepID=UPI00359CD9EB